MVQLTPVPAAHIDQKRRRPETRERDVSRDLSVQLIVSPSRRQSQRDFNLSNQAVASQHPYASAHAGTNYRTSIGPGYGRQSPSAQVMLNGNGLQMNQSEPYHPSPTIKLPGNSRENVINPGTNAQNVNGTRMGMYDRDHGDDGGHGRKKGLLSMLCCRA